MKKISKKLLDKAISAPVLTEQDTACAKSEDQAILKALGEDLPEFISDEDSDEEKAKKAAINAKIDAKNLLWDALKISQPSRTKK